MKKIFFILTFFVITTNVNALTVIRGFLDKNICSNDGEIYPMYFANIQERESYLLKPSKKIGVDTENYYNIPFESTSFPKDLKDYYFAFIQFQNYSDNFQIYHSLTQRLIWDYLYPEKEYKFCRNDKTIYSFHEEEYQKVKNKIQSVITGPDFFNSENLQISGITSEYKFDYFSSYYIFDNDNLDAYITDDTLFVNGKPGEYQIKFKKNKINYPIYLFDYMMTNGENYLFSSHSQNDVTYNMNIKIIDNSINVELYDDNKLLNNECIFYNDKKFCANENGVINLPNIENNEFNLLYKENDKYENYFFISKLSETNGTIKINLVKKKIDNFEEDEKKIDDTLNDSIPYEEKIKFENTFSVNLLPIFIIFALGVCFAAKKKH